MTLGLDSALTADQVVSVMYVDATSSNDSAAVQDAVGNDAADFTQTIENTVPQPVPSNWGLLPSGLGAGDHFRLVFLSSTTRDGQSTNIADYNTFVQTAAAAGHTDIRQYSSEFKVVGSTADVDARDNTATRYTGDDTAMTNDDGDVGVPIYWLGGNKVADEYRDFYDETWDDEANAKDESGNDRSISGSSDFPFTGSDHDGTEAFTLLNESRGLGVSLVRYARPNSASSNHGPLSSNVSTGNSSDHPFYGLSGVFVVEGSASTATEIWSAMLTVKEVQPGLAYGCSNEVSGKECSSLLDDDEFTYNGNTYRFVSLQFESGGLTIVFPGAPAEDFNSFELNAGGNIFSFQNATAVTSSLFTISLTGFSPWSADTEVPLSITVNVETNAAPVFPGDSATRELPENSPTGTSVGDPVTAMDDDGDTLAYTLEGTDAASFDIDASTGQIQTKSSVTYDHEAKSSYSVIVKADDSNGGTDTIAVTINVADVDEPPSVMTPPTVTPVTGSSDSLDVSWTAPDNSGKPDIESYDLQYRIGTSAWTDGPQDETGLSATITGLAAGTEYQVRVRATNDEGDSLFWSSTGTGTTNAQAQAPSILAFVTPNSGTYAIDQMLSVSVVFSAAVTVTGTPQLALDIGGETRQADYESGSGTETLLFSYTVAEDDEDTDGIEVLDSGLALNGGAISAGGEAATLTHGGRTYPAVLVDGVRPTLVSAETSVDGNTVSVTFSESLLSVFSDGFGVPQAGAPMVSSATIDPNDDRVVTLTLSRALSHDETPTLQIGPGTVQDAAGNYNAHLLLSDSITNNVPPPANAAPVFTSADNFGVSENQTAAGTVMATDADAGDTVTYAITGGDDQTHFQIVAASGVLTFATAPDHENPADTGTNNDYQVTVTATEGTGARALTTEQDITVTVNDVDETPAITSVSVVSNPGADNTYGLGDTIEVQVVFDQAVIVTGTPRIEFEVGGNQPEHLKLATYADGSGTTTLRFDYVVQSGDMDDNGIWLKGDKLELNGGTILGVDDDVAANLDYSSLGRQDDHKVDGSLTTAAGCGTLPTGRLWSACLTVGTFAAVGLTFLGWHDDGSYTGSSLTDEDFDYGGDTYNLKEIALLAGALSVIFTDASAGDIAAQATRDKLTLHVGDTETFNLGDGTLNSQQTGVAWSSAGLTWTDGDTVALSISVPVETTPVPTTWILVPSGLGDGDSFRLLFISTSNRDASSSDIADYNTFIQNLVDTNGHDDIKAHSATFRMLGSTEAVDARDNTGTTGTGVPIYWLGGAKVADDYADFYDGGWDEEATGRRETGASVSIGTDWKIWTGSAHDGTEAMNAAGTSSRALGNAGNHWVMQGSPNGSDSAHGPIASNTANRTGDRYLYGLSGVFTVDASLDPDNNPPTFTTGAAFSVEENETAVGTVEATDPDHGDTVTYAVTGGADQTHFDIDRASGALTFVTAPDYDDPADADKDNDYIVTVTATGGEDTRALTADQAITVTVANIIEPPGKPMGPWASWRVDNPGTLSVRWYAPHWWDESESFGKPPITSYEVRYQKGDIDDWGKWDEWEEWTYWPDDQGIPTVEAAANSAQTEFGVYIDGLEAGATYQLQVRAVNEDGAGVWSNRGSNRKPTGPVVEVDVNGDGMVDADPVITLPVGGTATYRVRPGRCEGYKSLNAQALRGTTENAPQNVPVDVSPAEVDMTCAGEDDPGEWQEITLTGPSDELLSTPFEASVRHTVMYQQRSHESWIFLMSWGHLVTAVVPAPETLEPVGSLAVTPEEGRDRPHVTWNAVPGVTDYQVQWRWGPDEEWGPFHSQGGATYTRQKVTEETAYTIPISGTVPTVNDVKRTQDVMVRVRPYDYDRLAVGPWREVTLPGRAVRPPMIIGTARVGQTLTADTSPITRESAALANAAFSYQWLRTGGAYGYYDIPGATDSTYTLTTYDEVRRIKVRVTFTNEEGEEETQTSSVTAKVVTGDADASEVALPASAAVLAGFSLVDAGASPQPLLAEPMDGASVEVANPDGGSYAIRADLNEGHTAGSVALELTGRKSASTTEGVMPYSLYGDDGAGALRGEALPAGSYVLTMTAYEGSGGGGAVLHTLEVSFTVTAAAEERRTGQEDEEEENTAPLTARFLYEEPLGYHSGAGTTLTVRLSFSEAVSTTPEGLEQALEVTNATIEAVSRVDDRSDLWEVRLTPHSDATVTVALSPAADCDAAGAVCTGDGRAPAHAIGTAKPGPPPNSQATGAPTIDGVAEVGQVLSAHVTGIDDDNAAFSYQWLRSDGGDYTEIAGANGDTYTLVAADQGKTIKVRVSFTDDEGNPESLTSDPTGEVEAAETVPGRPQDLEGEASAQGIALTWNAPPDSAVTSYVIYRAVLDDGQLHGKPMTRHATIEATGAAMSYTDADAEAGVEYRYRVAAVNSAGEGKKSTWINILAEDS